MKALLERIADGEVLLADGAMGSLLLERGLKPGECPEKMNLEHPEVLERIASEYFQAGSDILLTNTFGGSPLRLQHFSLDDQTEEINRAAIRAVRKSVGDKAYVALSCGPCGGLLQPFGELSETEVLESYTRQFASVKDEALDLICVETMTDINEAKLALKAAKSVFPALPVSVTMTFDVTPRGFFTIMGVTVEQAATELTAGGADLIGSNCGNGTEAMIEIAEEFKKHTTAPIVIQPNAGLPKVVAGQLHYPETPTFMSNKCRELIEAGVSIIGGCCGTTPEHIAAMRQLLV